MEEDSQKVAKFLVSKYTNSSLNNKTNSMLYTNSKLKLQVYLNYDEDILSDLYDNIFSGEIKNIIQKLLINKSKLEVLFNKISQLKTKVDIMKIDIKNLFEQQINFFYK